MSHPTSVAPPGICQQVLPVSWPQRVWQCSWTWSKGQEETWLQRDMHVIYIHACVCVYVCACARMYTYIYIYTQNYKYIYIYVCVCVCVIMYLYVYIYIYHAYVLIIFNYIIIIHYLSLCDYVCTSSNGNGTKLKARRTANSAQIQCQRDFGILHMSSAWMFNRRRYRLKFEVGLGDHGYRCES